MPRHGIAQRVVPYYSTLCVVDGCCLLVIVLVLVVPKGDGSVDLKARLIILSLGRTLANSPSGCAGSDHPGHYAVEHHTLNYILV
eukprot:2108794-Heterocapsa_arctica.AAC.1